MLARYILRDVCLTASRTHKVCLLSSAYIWDVETKITVLTVFWNVKSSCLLTKYFLLVECHLPSELMSPAKWSPRPEASSLCSIPQGLHPANKKSRIRLWIYPIFVDRENHLKINRTLTFVDWRPAFAVTLHCLGIPLRSARIVPLLK